MTDQYAIYRANLLTEGKNLWQKSFEQVRKEHLPVRIDLYRQIHISFSEKDESVIEIWKKTRDITEVSDVLVLNRSGEISCYYVNEDAPPDLSGLIRQEHWLHWIPEIIRSKGMKETGWLQMI